ncbi:hypothetical protein M8C21_019877 [Ambrosia artemisiifolia]|uniref:WAT1-related protein n=1 Tax=Ambrosia artemisiifolia TaxID=4212 RepID=A0AAD5GF77_AMBAR|nr:hypothetical protein M8C21_019877 [Ambrosia artemisiifolia]
MQRLKAILMMVAAQFAVAAFSISYKLASYDGMHMRVLITYRYLFASILIFPLALFLERNKRPKLTWSILFQAFLCAIFGGPMSQNMYAESLVLTSATFTVAFTNLIPPLTFIIAVLFRLEKVEIRKRKGKAKVIGTLVGVAGAMILTFYKGHQLNIKSTHFNFLHGGQHMDEHVATINNLSTHDHIFGSILALGYSISIALFYIFLSKLSVNYPCHYSNTFLYSVIGFLQSLVCVLPTERSWSKWKLNSSMRLFSAIFQGICAVLGLFLTTTVVHLEGPLFASIFNPLVLVFVGLADFLILGEKLYVGSLIGSIIVIVGLYLVLWGKGKETRTLSKSVSSANSKDKNSSLNTTSRTTTLKTTHMPHTSLWFDVDKHDELPADSSMENTKVKEILEEV